MYTISLFTVFCLNINTKLYWIIQLILNARITFILHQKPFKFLLKTYDQLKYYNIFNHVSHILYKITLKII
jgi:hypothetical protein